MTFTVFGGAGFVGQAIVSHLTSLDVEVWVPTREDIASGAASRRPLGHVIYSIGLTADFRTRLSDTVEAHVCLLDQLLNTTDWQSWLLLSSTRVFGAEARAIPCAEDAEISVRPSLDSVYDLSKLLGEAICLSRPEPTCRVARLSNVFGPSMPVDNFLASVANQSARGEDVTIRESAVSAKDYISVAEVARVLHQIAIGGRERLYHVASGQSVEHGKIATLLKEVFGVTVDFAADGKARRLPEIDIRRMKNEFGANKLAVLDQIRTFLQTLKSEKE